MRRSRVRKTPVDWLDRAATMPTDCIDATGDISVGGNGVIGTRFSYQDTTMACRLAGSGRSVEDRRAASRECIGRDMSHVLGLAKRAAGATAATRSIGYSILPTAEMALQTRIAAEKEGARR